MRHLKLRLGGTYFSLFHDLGVLDIYPKGKVLT